MTTKTDDQTTLYSIVNDLDANLMIEAGAGTGKTYALVSRVVALVKAGVRMQHIVAITFTEAAAAELSERIRSRMEQLLDDHHLDNVHDLLARDLSDQAKDRISSAVAELDQASVQTIHSFAAGILRERPLGVDLPPGWLQWDDLAASQDFAKRWDAWLADAMSNSDLVDRDLLISLRYLLESGSRDKRWREVSRWLSDNRGLISTPESAERVPLADVFSAALNQMSALMTECRDPADLLSERIAQTVQSLDSFITRAQSTPGATTKSPRTKRPR